MSDSSKLDKIEDKIDKVQEKIASIDSTLAAQHESLKIHIKRTNLLEQKITPIENHVAIVHALLKAIGFVAVLLSIIEGVLKIKNG